RISSRCGRQGAVRSWSKRGGCSFSLSLCIELGGSRKWARGAPRGSGKRATLSPSKHWGGGRGWEGERWAKQAGSEERRRGPRHLRGYERRCRGRNAECREVERPWRGRNASCRGYERPWHGRNAWGRGYERRCRGRNAQCREVERPWRGRNAQCREVE